MSTPLYQFVHCESLSGLGWPPVVLFHGTGVKLIFRDLKMHYIQVFVRAFS